MLAGVFYTYLRRGARNAIPAFLRKIPHDDRYDFLRAGLDYSLTWLVFCARIQKMNAQSAK